jgi:hypothetical protein
MMKKLKETKMSKNKGYDSGLGDFMIPLVEALTLTLMKIVELLGTLMAWSFDKYVVKGKRKQKLKKIERSSLEVKKATKNEESIGYSITQGKDLLFSDIAKKRHSVIVGASGFGKSVLLDTLMFDDLKNGKPVIFIDPKGDIDSLNQFKDLCRINNRSCRIFSEHYTGDNLIKLTPVKDGTVTHIADRIHNAFTWSEEHYSVLCYSALKKAVRELKSNDMPVSLDSIYATLIELSNGRDAKIKRSDIEGLILRLENIIDSDFGKVLGADGFSIDELWQKKECVYIGLPVLGYAKVAKSLGKMILGDLSYSVYNKYKTEEEKRPSDKVSVYIDELSAIITDNLIELMNKCRGVGMELNLAFQTPSDINKVSPDLCQQLFENGSNWLILKQRMEDSANMLSKAIGTMEGVKETSRVQGGEKQEEGSQRNVEESIVHPNIIKNLNEGQCVFLRHSPTRVDLINIKHISRKVVKHNVNFLNNWDMQINKLPNEVING